MGFAGGENNLSRLAGMEKDLRQSNEILLQLVESRQFNSENLQVALEAVCEAAVRCARVKRAGIWFFNADRTQMSCRASFDLDNGYQPPAGILESALYPRYFSALEETRSLAVQDARNDARTSELSDVYLKPENLYSLLDSAIRLDGRYLGVICLEHTGWLRDWTSEDEVLAGNIADLTALAMETHERREAETALQASEENYINAFRDSPIPTGITRLSDGRCVEVNKSWQEHFGYRREEIIGRNSMELSLWKDEATRHSFLKLLRERKSLRNLEFHFRTKAGDLRLLEVSATLLRFGNEDCILWASDDVTERRETERRTRESEERFRTLFEQLPIPSQVFAPDGTSIRVNAAWQRLYRLPERSLSGYNLFRDPQLTKAGVLDWIRLAFEGTPVTVPVIAYDIGRAAGRRESDVHWLSARFFPVMDAAERVLEVCCVYDDVTEQYLAEQEVHRLNAELEQRVSDRTQELREANQELEAFSYSVSHDLRAPLRHITSFASMLYDDAAPSLSGQSRRYLQIIRDSSKRMGQLIEDLLAFSRLSRSELRCAPVALNEILRQAQHELHLLMDGRDIIWDIEALPEVLGDGSLLRQVYVNLLSNALKYTRSRHPAHITIGCLTDHPTEFIFFVRDNGVGFDMQYSDKLFGVFQRLHSAKDFEGTGIGLANIRRIIARHGGRTWAEAAVNEGATFYFSLPRSRKESGE
jgi:PAS domain S-box-containing protein